MEWNNKIPEWKNSGTEPSETRKTKGFEQGFKPPAGIFNWFWALVLKALAEIQTKFGNHSDNKENPHEVTPAQIKAAKEKHGHTLDDVTETTNKKYCRVVDAISTDGVNYTATIDGITELYNGLTITIIPNMLSTSKNTTLNVNGLGAKQLRCSIGGYNFGNSGTIAALEGWLGADSPVTIQYKSKFDNWQTIISRPSVSGLYGTVKVEQGGTGATDAKTARVNIGAASSGYGYGEQMTEITSSSEETYAEYCEKIDAILASMANRETKQINAAPPYSEDATFGACAVVLYKGTNAYASLVTIGHSNKYAYGWRMQKRNGVWEEFEWIDPPMNTDVIYRTTERYKGNAVYKKLGSDNVLYWSTDKVTWNTLINAGTTDLAAGQSPLETGKLYFVYE